MQKNSHWIQPQTQDLRHCNLGNYCYATRSP